MMKPYFLAVALMGIAALTFAGCANETPDATASAGNPTDRTYTRDDINRSGRQTTGEAMQAMDPAVQVSGGR
jgi:hypothetical protein